MYKYIFLFIIIILVLYFVQYFNSITKSKYKYKTIQTFDNFLSNKQCDKLINMVKDKFVNSTIYSTNNGVVDKNARSSSCAYFKRGENELISAIESRVAKMMSIDKNQIEPIQIVRYNKNQEYKYHYDYFASNSNQYNNQRQYSILIYLNSLKKKDGGSTFFPLLKKSFTPNKGKCIIWNNLNPDGTENNLTLHAGQPVLTDKIKYVMTIWTRKYPY
jgi:prolyl 4-hydroxylase